MTRSRLNNHLSIAEHIVIGCGRQNVGLAILERAVARGRGERGWLVGEHSVMLSLRYELRGPGEQVGVGRVIQVVVREDR